MTRPAESPAMLMIVRSPLPSLRQADPASLPPEAARLLEPLKGSPHTCAWVVPSERRRRVFRHEWLTEAGSAASLLPECHTLDRFVARALEYSAWQRPLLGDAE